jgi:hypothetical protein
VVFFFLKCHEMLKCPNPFIGYCKSLLIYGETQSN